MELLEKKIFEKFQKDKWEIKTLEEISISDILEGNDIKSSSYHNEGDFPYITIEDILKSHAFLKDLNLFVNKSLVNKNTFIEFGDLVIITSDFISDNLAKSCAYLGDQKCMASCGIAIIKHSQNPKYLAYMMSSQYVKKQIKKLHIPCQRSRIYKKDLKKIKIPVPNISIQNEIVNDLDRLINLKQEMIHELKKIKIQYEYYREIIFK